MGISIDGFKCGSLSLRPPNRQIKIPVKFSGYTVFLSSISLVRHRMTPPHTGKVRLSLIHWIVHLATIAACPIILQERCLIYHTRVYKWQQTRAWTRERLGYSTMKPEQLQIVSGIVSERDVFAVLPTGFGKNLCYACLPTQFNLVLPVKGPSIVLEPAIRRGEWLEMHSASLRAFVRACGQKLCIMLHNNCISGGEVDVSDLTWPFHVRRGHVMPDYHTVWPEKFTGRILGGLL